MKHTATAPMTKGKKPMMHIMPDGRKMMGAKHPKNSKDKIKDSLRKAMPNEEQVE